MLVILRIGARMRALQADLKHGNPHHWAQRCFYAYTASVCVKTVSVLIMPFCLKCECKEGVSEGDAVLVMDNLTLACVITTIPYLAFLGLYDGFPAVNCSIFLILQYFTSCVVLFVSLTVKQLTNMGILGYTILGFESARTIVMFASMVSMFLIGTRMCVLQPMKATDEMTLTRAGSRTWGQDEMYLATGPVLVQLTIASSSP